MRMHPPATVIRDCLDDLHNEETAKAEEREVKEYQLMKNSDNIYSFHISRPDRSRQCPTKHPEYE